MVTPKLHMLENHVIPFLERVKIGLGFLGEQGAESIHARFNSLRRSYVTIPNRVNRLEAILKEHFNQIIPQNLEIIPEITRRPKHKRPNRHK